MARTLTLLLGALLWVLPNVSVAADGDYSSTLSYSSAWGAVEAFYLCDGNHAASENCAEINLKSLGSGTQKRSAPATIQFVLYRQSANCTPTVTVYGRSEATATAGATQVDSQVVALSAAATSSFAPAVPTLFKVYYATVSADADCTDLEVLMLLHYPNW